MAEKTQRIFIFVIVGAFLFSTLAFTGVIVFQMIGNNQNDVSDIDQSEFANQPPEGEQLVGTQLEGFEPIDEPTEEMQVIDLVEGTGEEVQKSDTIEAHYTGAHAVNGVIFESSRDSGEPVVFSLDELIPGWQKGIPGMKEDGTRRLIIPGELAYGEAPDDYSPDDPGKPLGPLVFDIELKSIQ